MVKQLFKTKLHYLLPLVIFSLFSCEDDIREVTLFEKGTVDATTSNVEIIEGGSVSYEDNSTKTQSLTWTFPGGNPATSFSASVSVDYAEPGVYTTLQTVKYIDNQTEVKEHTIYVSPLAVVDQEPFPRGASKLTETKIEMEDFDYGGENISYQDTEPENLGNSNYRFGHGVDIETTGDEEGDFDVTSTASGEWLEYTIFVANPSIYDINFRILATESGSTIKVQEINTDTSITDLTETAIISSSNSYTTVTASNVSLSSGEHTLRISFTGNGIKANYFEVLNTVFVAPIEKYGLYLEDNSAFVLESVNPGDLAVFSGNSAYVPSRSDDSFEGNESYHFEFQEVNDWGVQGIMETSTAVDATGWNYYNITLKSTSPGTMRLRIRGGGVDAWVVLDDALKTYGFVRDGNWHTLKIPLSEFKDRINSDALPDLTSIDRILVLRNDGGAVVPSDDWDYFVDNIFLSKE